MRKPRETVQEARAKNGVGRPPQPLEQQSYSRQAQENDMNRTANMIEDARLDRIKK